MTTAQRLNQIRRLTESLERIKSADYIITCDETMPGKKFEAATVKAAKEAMAEDLIFMEQVITALKGAI